VDGGFVPGQFFSAHPISRQTKVDGAFVPDNFLAHLKNFPEDGIPSTGKFSYSKAAIRIIPYMN
jgi:hypothetical protein